MACYKSWVFQRPEFDMRRLTVIAASLCAAAVLSLAGIQQAEAQSRKPLRVVVEGRSFLDAGKVAPVGHYNRHLVAAHGIGSSPIGNLGGFYGRDTLPGPFSGDNPFANSFYGPAGR
jgi:hypothetical protein